MMSLPNYVWISGRWFHLLGDCWTYVGNTTVHELVEQDKEEQSPNLDVHESLLDLVRLDGTV